MIEKYLAMWTTRAILAAIVALALWWVSDSVLEAIRAPVKRELAAAVDANASLAKDNQRLVEQNAKLDRILTARATFERGVNQRLTEMEQSFKGLKAANPAVKAWAETEIPPEALK